MSEPEVKRIRLTEAVIHDLLPKEMLVKILKELDYKSICIARRTCKFWNEVIVKFEVVKFVSCKFISQLSH